MKQLALLVASLSGAVALGAASAPGDLLVLINANVIDALEPAPLFGRTVLVREGRIEDVTEASSVPDGAAVVDLGGRYLLPGLIDAHVHVASVAQAQKALRSGVTTLRSMGTSHFADVGLRELAKTGATDLPEILAAGYHVTPAPAEGLFLDEPSLADLFSGVRGPEAFRRLTAANLRRGVDWIKTAATERAGLPQTDPRKQTMSEAELAAVVKEAQAAGVPVAAHAHGDEGGRAAVRAGVRSVEHGTYLSEDTLRTMKERGTYLVPTVAVVTDLVHPGGDYDDPALHVRGRHMLPRLREVVKRAREIGVAVVAATDTSYRADSTLTLQHDIEELVRSGLTPFEAIRAATRTAAEMMGIESRTGSIQRGWEADLIAVDRNPLEDILSLQDVLLVVNDGKVVLDRLSFSLSTAE